MFVLIPPMEKILLKICMKNNTLSYLLFRCRKKNHSSTISESKEWKKKRDKFTLHSAHANHI